MYNIARLQCLNKLFLPVLFPVNQKNAKKMRQKLPAARIDVNQKFSAM